MTKWILATYSQSCTLDRARQATCTIYCRAIVTFIRSRCLVNIIATPFQTLLLVLVLQGIATANAGALAVIEELAIGRSVGVSATGQYAAGRSFDSNFNTEGFFWSAATGKVGVGDLPGGLVSSEAAAVSDTGVVVGTSSATSSGEEAFRWTSSTGIVSIGTLGGSERQAITEDVSADGSIIVGMSKNVGNRQKVFRWTNATGMTEVTGPNLDPDLPTYARAISGDGSTIVGEGSFTGVFGARAFRWTAATGYLALETTAGGNSVAWETSYDGQVIVGSANDRAFRWTSATGVVPLADLPSGDRFRRALGVSGNGDLVVGDTGFNGLAAIWDATHGTRSLALALLNDYGLHTSDWILESATDVSKNGRVIVGYGQRQNLGQVAFRITIAIPEPRSGSIALLGLGAVICVFSASRRPQHLG
jgi:probable HAF family extracellular repeat protein